MSSKASNSHPTDWVGPSLLTAKTIAAVVEGLPFPYVKSVFGLAVVLLETIENGRRNREDLKELCLDIGEIMHIVSDHLTMHRDTAAQRFQTLCEDLEACLKDVLSAVKLLQVEPQGLHGRFREVVRLASTADRVVRYRSRVRNLRSNLVLSATMDTNFQIHKLAPISSASAQPSSVRTNSCPPPSRIFHGRQGILDKMYDYFSEDTPRQRVFLLHGLGGAGKTQIALTFIEEESSLFSDIFFIDASTRSTIESGLSEIASAKIAGDSPRDALQWLRTNKEKWLLFFDNADDPKLNLNRFLPRGRHGNVLIASRNPGLSVYAGSQQLVSDMDETDAVPLLLASAGQDDTTNNSDIAAEIVKELISTTRNRPSRSARLLSEVPRQSHDDYAWTVYTTWSISFQRLTRTAATLLQLCSFLHHTGISDKIFSGAAEAKYQITSPGPTEGDMQMPFAFLSQFLIGGVWDRLKFMDVTNELRAYSLINLDAHAKTFSIHPLVHAWIQSTLGTLSERAAHKACMTALIGMQVNALSPQEQDRAVQLAPHIDALLPDADVNPVVPPFHLEYGTLFYYLGQFSKAENLITTALATCTAQLGPDHFSTLVAMNHLGMTYMRLGRVAAAAEMQEIVLLKGSSLIGADNPYILAAARNLADMYNGLGRYEDALGLQVDIVDKSRKAYGDMHTNTTGAMANLAMMLMSLGRLREAEEMQMCVVDRRRKDRGENHLDTIAARGNLARIYLALGRLKEAEGIQAEVLRQTRDLAGDEHLDTFIAMGNIAATFREMGRLGEAERLEVEVLHKRRELLGEKHPDTLLAMGNLAWTWHLLGRLVEAEGLGAATVEKRRVILGDAHPQTIKAAERLAKTLEQLSKAEILGVDLPRAVTSWGGDTSAPSIRMVCEL
ncbi:hypothetical protein FB45DRAFT_1064418 [Roridomyces roridus]|uniref:DUF7779 domain-containing protein n=1 Tax=Roridomyces roridus TaxID=1738132 RepID=A0AAD7BAF4_9AGAR|nr:hypothetical protein FB45DRAFT_1064418 [Roridomyces roridus]